MDLGIFDFLEGLSPWWWVAGGIALGAVEMATMSFFLIWPGLAALAMAGVVALAPDLSGEVQVALFALLAVAFTFLGRGVMHRWGDGGAPVTDINNRAAQMVGRHAKVLGVEGSEARVEIDGMHWQAVIEGAGPEAGQMAEVSGADGMRLRIRSLNPD